MELRTLRYFVTVAEELNITRAAEILNMSQPPLSSQMKNLEDELGTTLFIRGRRSLTLTESGQLLYRRAKEILKLSEKASAEIRSMGEGMTGTISIGLVEGMAPDIASDWIAGFMKIYPQVRFRILHGNSDDLIEKMRSGLISLAVITAPYDQLLLNGFSVGQDKLIALMSSSHPLASSSGDEIGIADLKYEPLIVPSRRASIESVYRMFRSLNSDPRIICEVDSFLDASPLAAQGVGIGLFPRTGALPGEGLAMKKLRGKGSSNEYIFVWRKGHPLPTVEEMFIDYIKEHTL
ncbi:MAG: LysR family transcriptional regulator [Clostridia bacterium]|nr:LysR family transcriptional regulator [Clostridia bacterium]